MKILFIQLPLADHNLDYVEGNIPYASETISGYIISRYKNIAVETLPYIIACFASDRVIENYAVNSECDIIAFTCYAWNIERSLKIASSLKRKNPSLKIIFGGPEIAEGSFALRESFSAIDFFISGEGEWFFDKFLSHSDFQQYETNLFGNRIIIQPETELIPADEIFDPFNGKRLTPMIDGSIFLELTRGCPFRCSYCYYSKNCLAVRELPFERLINAFSLGAKLGLTEIYILSPTFNSSKNFISNLEHIRSVNKGVSLHTEMRADKIDSPTARLIREAGFASLEIGLQTMNTRALKAAGRNTDPIAEAEGIIRLKKAGIDLKIGMIPGLPGDDPDSFMRGIERLNGLGLGGTIELYSLMILPGTRIRETADNNRYTYQKKPPYLFLEGENFSFDDMAEIRGRVEDISGFSSIITRIPDLSFSETGILCKGIIFNGDIISNWDPARIEPFIDTNPFTIQIKTEDNNPLRRGIPILLDKILNLGLFNIVFRSNMMIDEDFISGYMLKQPGDNYLARSNVFGEWREGLSARFYQAFDDINAHTRAFRKYNFIEPIFCIRGDCGHLPIETAGRAMIFAEGGSWPKFKDFFIEHYSETPELVSFENDSEQKLFYDEIGFKYTRYPFSFKTKIL